MMKYKLMFLAVLFAIIFAGSNGAQAQNRAAVSGREVTGIYRSYFDGKFKGSYNEIKIQALGKGKLKVSFDLTYPYKTASGEMTANVGTNGGTATIEGDTAVFKDLEFGQCTITLKFTKPGTLVITQQGTDGECGFGHNVSADGTYKKVSRAKPKFESN